MRTDPLEMQGVWQQRAEMFRRKAVAAVKRAKAATAEVEVLGESLAASEEARRALQAHLKQLQESSAEDELETATSALRAAAATVTGLERECDELEGKLADAERVVSDLRADYAASQRQVRGRTLQAAFARLSALVAG